MKKALIVLSVLCLISSCALADDDLFKVYPLSDRGEAIVDDVSFFGQAPSGSLDRVFYEIFVGSFSDSDGDGTGDLRGIINRLDYLNDGDPRSGLSLGAEGLWLTPVFSSPTYHKYDVADFYTVDPAFGTLDDLKELVDKCHERNVKVILDLPINHTGTGNRWFRNFTNAHLMHNPGNAYYDFYVWQPAGDPQPAGRHFTRVPGLDIMVEANFSDSMPELNFDNESVREAVLDVAKFYLDLGVDGFRFDAAKYIYLGENQRSVDFWSWYIGEIRKIKSDVYTVSEVWDGEGIINQYTAAGDCFNFTLSQVNGLIAETAKAGDVNRFTAYMDRYLDSIREAREGARSVLFISNHDMDRCAGYLTVASGQMKTAANLYILSPGSPFIYYGEEIGLRGSRGGANTDANRRLAMLWGDGDTVKDPAGTTYDSASQTPYSVADLKAPAEGLYNYYKRLIMIRAANPEIAGGDYTALKIPDSKMGGFIVSLDGSDVMVMHNTTQRKLTVDLSTVTDIPFTVLADFIGAGEAKLNGTVLTLEGQTSAVLRRE